MLLVNLVNLYPFDGAIVKDIITIVNFVFLLIVHVNNW